MADVYQTIDGDTVDLIAWRHYGRHGGTTELIYEANRGLAFQPLVLPAGIEITLPDLPTEEPVKAAISLYD